MNENPAEINLDRLHVASPCHARWEDMVGDDRTRFCGGCQKHVYNFSAMTRPEVAALIQAKEGGLCGRFYQRADGRLLTADCPEGLRRRRTRVARWCSSLIASVLLFCGVRAAWSDEETNDTRMLGEVGYVPKPVAPHPPTNALTVRTNPILMGKIALPPRTNAPKMGDIVPTNPPPVKSPGTNAPKS